MAEQVGKFLTELPELETPTDGDLMYIVDDETTSKKVTMANLKRVLGGNVTGTVEGASVSFSDGADSIPMEECEVTISPTQDLHGYSKPWAGGAGKNKLPNTQGNESKNGVTCTKNSDGTYTFTGTASASSYFIVGQVNIPAGTYTLSGCPTGGGSSTYRLYFENPIGVNDTGSGASFTISEQTQCNAVIVIVNGCVLPNEGIIFEPMVRLSTEPSTFEPYSNICPISGHTDVTVTVASTSGGSGEDTTVSLGRTVYKGSLDVTTGLLTVTHAITDVNTVIANRTTSYSNPVFYGEISGMKVGSQTIIAEAFNGIESKLSAQNFANNSSNGDCANNSNNTQFFIRADEYTDVPSLKTALGTTKIQYELATPQTFTLTPTQVLTLLGQNYVSHDGGGNIKVVYIRDLDITINDLIDRVTALQNE